MIQIDTNSNSYVCPFCGHTQAYYSSVDIIENGANKNTMPIFEGNIESSFSIYTLYCKNNKCKRVSVTAINRTTGKQVDIVPQIVIKQWPSYIPLQIRQDYEEAVMIIEASPKASATLLRRCLQGMIHDFWKINEKNLNAEITSLKDKISGSQWKAIDGLRKLGNIGAHMESDVNLIIDIDTDEAKKLLRLIELLLDKWYIARHDEEVLLNDISSISEDKEKARKKKI